MKVRAVVLGDRCVGKTQFLNHLRNLKTEHYCPTVGVDFACHRVDGVSLQLWDSSGSSRFRHVVDTFARTADLCIFMYRTKRHFETMMDLIADAQRKEHGKRYCIIGLDNFALGHAVAEKYGFVFYTVNVYDRADCMAVLSAIVEFCKLEHARSGFLGVKPAKPPEREEGYCWRFC